MATTAPTGGPIVVGADGSATSLTAVERAATIAAALNRRLVVACAVRPDGAAQPAELPERAAAERLLEPALERAREIGAPDVEFRAEPGSPVAALAAVAGKEDALMLVVGNRGMNSLSGRLLGSIPADLARVAECDVLIVRSTPREAP